jgi:hypothetical protein
MVGHCFERRSNTPSGFVSHSMLCEGWLCEGCETTRSLPGATANVQHAAAIRVYQTMRLTPCPLDEEFWNRYVLGRMTYLAEHASADGLAGAVLDPEMYGADHTSYGTVCYCPDCMREFFQAAGREAPNPLPPPGERAVWLRQNGLAQRFEHAGHLAAAVPVGKPGRAVLCLRRSLLRLLDVHLREPAGRRQQAGQADAFQGRLRL